MLVTAVAKIGGNMWSSAWARFSSNEVLREMIMPPFSDNCAQVLPGFLAA